MRNLRKGLSLVAVAAFLTLALVPMGAFAAPAGLDVLTTSVSVNGAAVNASGDASSAEQYAALPTAAAVIMPGQSLQLQVNGTTPATAPSGEPLRSGWLSGAAGASVAEVAAAGNSVPNAPGTPAPGAAPGALTVQGAATPAPSPSVSPSQSPAASQTEAPSTEPSAAQSAEASATQTAEASATQTAEASATQAAEPTEAPSPSASATDSGSQRISRDGTTELPVTDVAVGSSRSYAYVQGPYAPADGSSASTWWGAGFNVRCVQPALTWSGLYTSSAPQPGTQPSSTMTAGQTQYGTVTWSGALPPTAPGSTTGNPAITATVTGPDGKEARGLVCNLPGAGPATQMAIELQAAANLAGGQYTVEFAPQATEPAAISSIAIKQNITVLGYQLESASAGTSGSVGQPATSVVQWRVPGELIAGAPADAAQLVYVWAAQQSPAPQFGTGKYDAATGTITATTTAPLTEREAGEQFQYAVQAFRQGTSGAADTPVGPPILVTLGSISNYTLVPSPADQSKIVVAAGSVGTSSVAWATGGASQIPPNASGLTYEWTATGTNAASAPTLTATSSPASGAIATATTSSVLTTEQAGTYTYAVQAYEGTGTTKTRVGNPASITMEVVVPVLEGDPAIIRATTQSVTDKLLRVKWSDQAAPTDAAWLENVSYSWTPMTEDDSNWPVVNLRTQGPTNALRSNFVGGSPNVYKWSVQAIYTDPQTGRASNIGNAVELQLDLYTDNVLCAAYPIGNAFMTKVGQMGGMSVEWANGFLKSGETYTWTAPEGAPAIPAGATGMQVEAAAPTVEQGGKTFTYSVQPYTAQGAPDGNPAQVNLYVQPYLLKPAEASPTVLIGQTASLEAAWSADGGAAVPAEGAQITYIWTGPNPQGGPAVTGDGLKATVAAASVEGEWTYTLTAQTGSGETAQTIATASFTVTAVSPAPSEGPALTPTANSDVSISTVNNVKYVGGAGLVVSGSGHTVDDVISLMDAPVSGYEIQITGPTGQGVKEDNAIVGTGDHMQLVSTTSGGQIVEEAVVIVRGDVTGSGRMTLTQLVRMASALTEDDPLEGANLMAADMNGEGGLTLTDLVQEAALYRKDAMRPSSTASQAPSATAAASPSASAEPSPSASVSAEASASAEPSPSAEASASASASA